MASVRWNPWHGCHKVSEGCLHCYVYRQDALWDKDASQVARTAQFDLPVRRNRRTGAYVVPPGSEIYTCFTSDFFVDEADAWRAAAWAMMRERRDCSFILITKRIDRFRVALPDDWGAGWEHVRVCCTCETQARADARLPLYLSLPIPHRTVVCEPLLERLDLRRYLSAGIEALCAGGESGADARVCDYDWVLDLRRQCDAAGVGFLFHQTGARLCREGRIYRIPRALQHAQARRAGIDTLER